MFSALARCVFKSSFAFHLIHSYGIAVTTWCFVRIWIDLANSPHVPLFRALAPRFEALGHTVEFSARDFAQTVALAEDAGLKFEVIGVHGGRKLNRKAGNLLARAASLYKWAKPRRFDLAVSHNSYSQVLASWKLGLPTVTMMDYEHQPANHLAFRFASRIVVPDSFPQSALRRFGAKAGKVRRYQGIKEDVYLAEFQPDAGFQDVLGKLGVEEQDLLVVVRPPAYQALYHRFENDLFDLMLDKLAARADAKIILLARTDAQGSLYHDRGYANFIFPQRPIDGSNLIYAADLVISGGGTMNREAAALGTPAATIYAGDWAAVDEGLVRDGSLIRIKSLEDIANLGLARRPHSGARKMCGVRDQVVSLILETADEH